MTACDSWPELAYVGRAYANTSTTPHLGFVQGVAAAATAALAAAGQQQQEHAASLAEALERSSGKCLMLQRELVDGAQSATALALSLQQVRCRPAVTVICSSRTCTHTLRLHCLRTGGPAGGARQ